MKDHEYDHLDLMSYLNNYEPTQRFIKYRFNIILLSGASLFYLLSGFRIDPDNVNLFFLKGSMTNTWTFPCFLFLYLIYNMMMFRLIQFSEISKFKLQWSLQNFYIQVAIYQAKKYTAQASRISFRDMETNHFSISQQDNNQLSVSFNIESMKLRNPNFVSELTNITIEEQGQNFEIHPNGKMAAYNYSPSEQDKQQYKLRSGFIRHTSTLNFIDVTFPYFVGFLAIALYIIKYFSIR